MKRAWAFAALVLVSVAAQADDPPMTISVRETALAATFDMEFQAALKSSGVGGAVILEQDGKIALRASYGWDDPSEGSAFTTETTIPARLIETSEALPSQTPPAPEQGEVHCSTPSMTKTRPYTITMNCRADCKHIPKLATASELVAAGVDPEAAPGVVQIQANFWRRSCPHEWQKINGLSVEDLYVHYRDVDIASVKDGVDGWIVRMAEDGSHVVQMSHTESDGALYAYYCRRPDDGTAFLLVSNSGAQAAEALRTRMLVSLRDYGKMPLTNMH